MELQRYRKPNIRIDSICKNSQRKYNPAWRNPPRPQNSAQNPKFSYLPYRSPTTAKNTSKRGTAVLIRRGIVHQPVNIQTKLDSTSVNIKLENNIAQVTAVYKSPGVTVKPTDFDALTNHDGPLIIGGDLNAKHTDWQCPQRNKSGKTLAQHAERVNRYSVVAPDSPTHYPYIAAHRPDILDIFLLDLPNTHYLLTNHCELSSDHNPQMLNLSSRPSMCGPPSARKRINWRKFQTELTLQIKNIRITTIDDINKNIDQLTKVIQSEIKNCSYESRTLDQPKSTPDDILLEIDTKRLLRKHWQRTRDPQVKTLYNAQVSHVKDILTRHRQSEWNSFTATLNFKNKSIYKLNRRLLHKQPKCQPLKAPDETKIYDTNLKAELFADTMSAQLKNNPGPP
ncbi:unnamed protein product [Macrosiphum euphorbiae]|uniref:Endonuclease/exonuclease/phosphatase domain-containing protein n=1 Tax=Macrosiphum euphorbiae TaxID=13131 RepID=A0AAV0XIT8_9HEMI|nr:unnamed protein product [Macrosiphum euphorbiae]CAI6368665.1 unnamed protein product [Macrosiphum euphorbiae]